MERASLSFHFTAQLLCLSSYGSAFVVFIYGLAVVLSSYGSAVAACGGLPPCACVFYYECDGCVFLSPWSVLGIKQIGEWPYQSSREIDLLSYNIIDLRH